VKGDSRCYCIAAASVLAKVHRDHLMVEYDKQYPEYDLATHKGYPTAAHQAAVRKHGPSPIHRLTFAPLKNWYAEKAAAARARAGPGALEKWNETVRKAGGKVYLESCPGGEKGSAKAVTSKYFKAEAPQKLSKKQKPTTTKQVRSKAPPSVQTAGTRRSSSKAPPSVQTAGTRRSSRLVRGRNPENSVTSSDAGGSKRKAKKPKT